MARPCVKALEFVLRRTVKQFIFRSSGEPIFCHLVFAFGCNQYDWTIENQQFTWLDIFFPPVLRTTTSGKALEDHHSRSCGTTFAALKCPYLVHTLAYAMQLLLRTWGDIVYHLNEDSVLPDLFPSAQTDINRYFSLSFPTHLKARFYWEAWCFVWYPEVCFRLEPCTGIHFKTEPYPCLRHSDPTWARCFYQM